MAVVRSPDFLPALNQRDCACNIDPAASSYAIMRRAGPYSGENSGPVKNDRVELDTDIVMIFMPLQCRMARAALGWGVRELAAAAKVSTDTVARFERGDELKERTIEELQRALVRS